MFSSDKISQLLLSVKHIECLNFFRFNFPVNVIMLVGLGFISALLAFMVNWLALIPWRSTRGRHWSERARLYHPVRVGAVSNLWVLPAVATLSVLVLFPGNGPHWAFVAVVSSIGTLIGTIPMDREVFPEIPLNHLLRQSAKGWVIRFLVWFVFLGAAALMPQEFDLRTIVLPAIVIGLLIWWSHGGWLKTAQKLGSMTPAPTRLMNIVRDVSTRMNVPVKEVLLVVGRMAQAYALPSRRALLFSNGLLQVLSDDEIAAVCAHELGHLTERRGDYYKRYIVWLMFLPWLLLTPVVYNFGTMGFICLMVMTCIIPAIFRRISHRLELRADSIAKANEPDVGTYARALAKIYENNLVPAVNAKDRATHPHLYDRLLAAGVTPEFARPARASAVAWNGLLFSFALGALAVILVSQMTTVSMFR
jgi:Zn-dependent protease with chaperone function